MMLPPCLQFCASPCLGSGEGGGSGNGEDASEKFWDFAKIGCRIGGACRKSCPKAIKDPSYNWDESNTLGDRDIDVLGWIVPPSLQSLVLCPVEKSAEVASSYRLCATKWPVEVDLEEAVQDLSCHRCFVGQELDLHGSGEGHPANADKAEIDEFVRTLVSCEEQADEYLVILTCGIVDHTQSEV